MLYVLYCHRSGVMNLAREQVLLFFFFSFPLVDKVVKGQTLNRFTYVN